ncbi:hypothetical protein HS7_12260 [Sulfolobales archaeon HS-7]|nr:hypothetical protein HS7_12260 [Sulfolobales archaeon HS-7]
MRSKVIIAIVVILVASSFLYLEARQSKLISSSQETVLLIPAITNNATAIGNQYYWYPLTFIRGNEASLIASPFMWNVEEANGYSLVTYNRTGFYVLVNLTNVKKTAPGTPVLGYPGLMYGAEEWFPFENRTYEVSWLPLPEILGQTPNFTSTVKYALFLYRGSITDFSYDIWLTPQPGTNVSSITKGDLEVMFWMYYTENLSRAPYYQYAGSITLTDYINGTKTPISWNVWVLNVSGGGWTLVVFTPKIPLYSGEFEIPVGIALKQLSVILESKAGWKDSILHYYLDAIQVGMEINNQNGVAVGGYHLYSWEISE